jgi:hypothetical protein
MCKRSDKQCHSGIAGLTGPASDRCLTAENYFELLRRVSIKFIDAYIE